MVLLFTLLGLVFGSFAGATAWRVYKRMEAEESGKPVARKYSVSRGRSMCEACGHELVAEDLVPLVSWLVLRGRCRYCHAKLSWEYPLVELATATLFAVSYLVMRPSTTGSWLFFGIWLVLLVCLVILAVTDLKWYVLPDAVVLPALVLGLALAATGLNGGWQRLVLAGLVSGGVFFALHVFSGGKYMGDGDIRLAALMGVLLGPARTFLAMFIGFNSAAVISLALLSTKRKKAKDQIPFGPFLIAGLIIAWLWGAPILEWYLQSAGL